MFLILNIIIKDLKKYSKKVSFFLMLSSSIFLAYLNLVDERYTSYSKLLPVGASSSIGKNYNAILQNLTGDMNESDPILNPFIYNEILNSYDFVNQIMGREVSYKSKDLSIYEILAEIYNKDLNDPKDKLDLFEVFTDEFYNTNFNTLTNMIELKISFFSPEAAKEIVQITINDLINAQDNFIKSRNLTEISYLQNQVIEIKKSIEKLEDSLIEFLNENKDLSSPILSVEYQKKLTEISIENSILSTTKINFENQKLEQLKQTDTLYIIEKPSLPVERSYPLKVISMMIFFMGYLIITFIFFYWKNYNQVKQRIV